MTQLFIQTLADFQSPRYPLPCYPNRQKEKTVCPDFRAGDMHNSQADIGWEMIETGPRSYKTGAKNYQKDSEFALHHLYTQA